MRGSKVSKFNNVHKLLRIVWVYVENCCEAKVNQGTLPIELARELVGEENLNNMHYEVGLPETEVYAALEQLLDIFYDVYQKTNDERFKPPVEWETSNPCQDAVPRFRR